jgi:hypothetical protein
MNYLRFRQGASVVIFCFAMTFLMLILAGPDYTHAQEQKEPCLEPYISNIVPNAAKPGEEVRIIGRRFRHETGKVTFSPGVEGQIVSWQNRRISVIVPESARSGPVTVSVPCGSVSNEKHFTVKE